MTFLNVIVPQLLTVLFLLAALPLAVRLLWKLRVLPLAVCVLLPYLMGARWAAEHRTILVCMASASALFAVLAWAVRIYRWKQEQRFCEERLLAKAKPLYRVTEDGSYVLNIGADSTK